MNTDGITLAYIVMTCGLTPCLYFLGIPEHRQKLAMIIQSLRPETKHQSVSIIRVFGLVVIMLFVFLFLKHLVHKPLGIYFLGF